MDYDQTPILSRTGYTYDEVRRFTRFHLRRLRGFFIGLTAFYGVCVVLLAAIRRQSRQPMAPMIPWLVYLLFFAVGLCYLNGLFYTRKAHDKNIRLFRNGQRFTFRNYDFTAENEQADHAGQSMMHYASLHKVVETNDMFYLYLGQRQAYLVSKEGFQNAGPEQLRELLRQSLPPKKYKIHITYRLS